MGAAALIVKHLPQKSGLVDLWVLETVLDDQEIKDNWLVKKEKSNSRPGS